MNAGSVPRDAEKEREGIQKMATWNEDSIWNQADRDYTDPVFGTIRWLFAEGEWQVTKNIAPDLSVNVRITAWDDRSKPDFDPTHCLPQSASVWENVVRNYPAIHAAAAAEAVSRCANWREPEDPAYGDAQIAAKVVPCHVTIYVRDELGKVAIVHLEDGDLFGGHSLDVDVSATGEPLDVSMNG